MVTSSRRQQGIYLRRNTPKVRRLCHRHSFKPWQNPNSATVPLYSKWLPVKASDMLLFTSRESAGPSGVDAYAWRPLCSSFKNISNDFCNALTAVASRLCTSNLPPDSLMAFCGMLPHSIKQKPWCKTNRHWWSTMRNHCQSNTKNRWQVHPISSRTTAGMRWLWGRVWSCSSCNEDYLCLRWRRRYSIGGCK